MKDYSLGVCFVSRAGGGPELSADLFPRFAREPSDDGLHSIIYTSTAGDSWSSRTLHGLAATSHERNVGAEITGRLIHHNGCFWQSIEGPTASVQRLYAAIESDPRHHHINLMFDGVIATRSFPDWAMESPAMAEFFDDFNSADTDDATLETRDALASGAFAGITPGGTVHLHGKKPAQTRSADALDRLLDAGKRFFAERGVIATTNATMAEFANDAGVSLKSAYRYFPNPTAIFRALAWRHDRRKMAALRIWGQSATCSSEADAARQIAAALAHIFLGTIPLPPRMLKVVVRDYHAINYAALAESAQDVTDWLQRNNLPPGRDDRTELIGVAFAAISGAIKMIMLHAPSQIDTERTVDQFTTLLLAAIVDTRATADH